VNGAPFQPAIAVGSGLPDEYFAGVAAGLQATRDTSAPGSRDAGSRRTARRHLLHHRRHPAVRPDGDGMAFCRSLPERCGVVAVPNEVFYARPEHGRTSCGSRAASAPR
jgi:N-succinyldiaminopimelate aminotransferase